MKFAKLTILTLATFVAMPSLAFAVGKLTDKPHRVAAVLGAQESLLTSAQQDQVNCQRDGAFARGREEDSSPGEGNAAL